MCDSGPAHCTTEPAFVALDAASTRPSFGEAVVGPHDGLRTPGRARGKEQQRDVRVDGSRCVEAHLACDSHRSACCVDPGLRRLALGEFGGRNGCVRRKHDEPRSRTGAHRNELGRTGACIDGCGPGADALGREHQQRRRDIVLRDDQDAIARPQPKRGKLHADPLHGLRGRGEVDRASGVAIGGSRRRLARVLEQPVRDNHCRALQSSRSVCLRILPLAVSGSSPTQTTCCGHL